LTLGFLALSFGLAGAFISDRTAFINGALCCLVAKGVLLTVPMGCNGPRENWASSDSLTIIYKNLTFFRILMSGRWNPRLLKTTPGIFLRPFLIWPS
jgi:hypothetical protein